MGSTRALRGDPSKRPTAHGLSRAAHRLTTLGGFARHGHEESGMAVLRENPYQGFNFLVDLGDGQTDGPHAGFHELSGLSMEVEVVEYRNGNSKTNGVTKLTGLYKTSDLQLRRGIVGALNLYAWLDQVRNGDANAMRTVTVQLQSEDRTAVVQTWKLLRARIVKHTSGPLNAVSSDVAMEEIVLAYERLELE
jgi:phage tail-like protein